MALLVVDPHLESLGFRFFSIDDFGYSQSRPKGSTIRIRAGLRRPCPATDLHNFSGIAIPGNFRLTLPDRSRPRWQLCRLEKVSAGYHLKRTMKRSSKWNGRAECCETGSGSGRWFGPDAVYRLFGQTATKLITKPIPSSGEQIPVVGIGTARRYEAATPEDRAEIKEVLRLLPELGGKVIDTAHRLWWRGSPGGRTGL